MHWTIIERAWVPGFFEFMFWPFPKSNEIVSEEHSDTNAIAPVRVPSKLGLLVTHSFRPTRVASKFAAKKLLNLFEWTQHTHWTI